MLKKKQEKFSRGEIIFYKPAKGDVELRVRLEGNTIWLSLNQIADLFDRDKSVISRHIRNIFQSGELPEKATVAKIATVQKEGKREILRDIEYFNLDVIISVGYRVDSKNATQFRIWATKILKQYLLQGYVINEKRLLEAKNQFNKLQETIAFLQKQSKKELLKDQGAEILSLLTDYAKTFSLLEQYDKGKLKSVKGEKSAFVLEYKNCVKIVAEIKKQLMAKKEAGNLFGHERGGEFEGIINGLYQTFARKKLYPSIEDKAAHLLYLLFR